VVAAAGAVTVCVCVLTTVFVCAGVVTVVVRGGCVTVLVWVTVLAGGDAVLVMVGLIRSLLRPARRLEVRCSYSPEQDHEDAAGDRTPTRDIVGPKTSLVQQWRRSEDSDWPMVKKIPQSRPPGAEIVPCGPNQADSGRSALLLATDLAVGAASQATRLALRVSATGLNASVAAGRIVSALPGANGAGQLLNIATRPLVDSGREARTRALSAAKTSTQRLLEAVAPGLLDTLDIDALVQRIDIDRLVRGIEVDDLVGRIDIDALVRRIDIDRLVRGIEIDDLVGRIDIDVLVQRIDLDAVVARVDVNRVAERIDIDAVVEQTELGTIVARSTSGFASEALDAARSQAADVDTRVSRMVNRVLRRKESEVPAGPPLLTGEIRTEDATSEPSTEPASADAPDEESK
jgi:hypothetical protein